VTFIKIYLLLAFKLLFLFCSYRLQEEAGNAGEQPASNKADGDD